MYNKLFTKILDSSIWMESLETRIVWLTFIAAMDEDGFVQFASVENVAHRARVGVEAASVAVRTLESPDSNSSDPENGGRRVERVPGGWMVLNSQKYRRLVTRVVIQEQTKNRVRRFREKKRSGNAQVTHRNETVTPSETDTDTKAVAENTHTPRETISETAIRLAKQKASDEAADHLNAEVEEEERRLSRNLVALRDSVSDLQAALDLLPRPKGIPPFSAFVWLRNGQSGIPCSSGGLTVRRLLSAAIEARTRAQNQPNISDSNRETLENLKRAGDRIRARRAETKPKEIAG